MFYKPQKVFAGHIKVLGGPHVARRPDVAQTWFRPMVVNQVACAPLGALKKIHGCCQFWKLTYI